MFIECAKSIIIYKEKDDHNNTVKIGNLLENEKDEALTKAEKENGKICLNPLKKNLMVTQSQWLKTTKKSNILEQFGLATIPINEIIISFGYLNSTLFNGKKFYILYKIKKF